LCKRTLYFKIMRASINLKMRSRIFSTHNAKLVHCAKQYNLRLAAFDLPAGHTCPAAHICKSIANKETGRIKDYGSLRCYAVSAENIHPNVRVLRHRNLELTKQDSFVDDICHEIKRLKLTSIRIHSSGDFYNRIYLEKWIRIARLNPSVTFWGYTKMLPFYTLLNEESNVFFVYSIGGLFDNRLTGSESTCTIVTDGMIESFPHPITCERDNPSNDYEYIINGESFGIRLHGTQPAKK